jgi:WD40 repeat protein
MGLAGATVSRRGAVAPQHGARAPAGQPHQVGLAPALGQPLVGEGMAQLVGVQAGEVGLLPTTPEHQLYAPGGELAALAKPQPRRIGVLMPGPHPKVAVKGHGGLAAKPVRIWDLTAGTQLHQLTGHTGRVSAVTVITLEGRPVAITGGDDATVRIWELADGTQLLIASLGARVWRLTSSASNVLVVATPMGLVALRLHR